MATSLTLFVYKFAIHGVRKSEHLLLFIVIVSVACIRRISRISRISRVCLSTWSFIGQFHTRVDYWCAVMSQPFNIYPILYGRGY